MVRMTSSTAAAPTSTITTGTKRPRALGPLDDAPAARPAKRARAAARATTAAEARAHMRAGDYGRLTAAHVATLADYEPADTDPLRLLGSTARNALMRALVCILADPASPPSRRTCKAAGDLARATLCTVADDTESLFRSPLELLLHALTASLARFGAHAGTQRHLLGVLDALLQFNYATRVKVLARRPACLNVAVRLLASPDRELRTATSWLLELVTSTRTDIHDSLHEAGIVPVLLRALWQVLDAPALDEDALRSHLNLLASLAVRFDRLRTDVHVHGAASAVAYALDRTQRERTRLAALKAVRNLAIDPALQHAFLRLDVVASMLALLPGDLDEAPPSPYAGSIAAALWNLSLGRKASVFLRTHPGVLECARALADDARQDGETRRCAQGVLKELCDDGAPQQ